MLAQHGHWDAEKKLVGRRPGLTPTVLSSQVPLGTSIGVNLVLRRGPGDEIALHLVAAQQPQDLRLFLG